MQERKWLFSTQYILDRGHFLCNDLVYRVKPPVVENYELKSWKKVKISGGS